MPKTLRGRSIITDQRILGLITECVRETKEMGYALPSNLVFLECNAQSRAGQATIRADGSRYVTLSLFLYKEPEVTIKSVIYHELAHIIAGIRAKHGPVWKQVARKMSLKTGIAITRTWSEEDCPIHAEERKATKKQAKKYIFRCKGCGAMVRYSRRTVFVKTYDEMITPSKPRWFCTKCHSMFEMVNKED